MKYRLTPKEYEIASFIAKDKQYVEIAKELGVHWTMVRNYAIKARKKTSSTTDRMMMIKFNSGEIYT